MQALVCRRRLVCRYLPLAVALVTLLNCERDTPDARLSAAVHACETYATVCKHCPCGVLGINDLERCEIDLQSCSVNDLGRVNKAFDCLLSKCVAVPPAPPQETLPRGSRFGIDDATRQVYALRPGQIPELMGLRAIDANEAMYAIGHDRAVSFAKSHGMNLASLRACWASIEGMSKTCPIQMPLLEGGPGD